MLFVGVWKRVSDKINVILVRHTVNTTRTPTKPVGWWDKFRTNWVEKVDLSSSVPHIRYAESAAMFGGDIKAAFSNWINTLSGRIIALAHHQALCNRAAKHQKHQQQLYNTHYSLSRFARRGYAAKVIWNLTCCKTCADGSLERCKRGEPIFFNGQLDLRCCGEF